MIEPALSADAQATALLVGRFGKGQAKPLSRNDFNRVAHILHQRGMRPSDLFKQVPGDLPVESDRISGLISRGTALALAVESWNQMGVRFVSRGDEAYPGRFKRLLKGGSAPIIYYSGDLSLLERPTLGVVGSRDATDAGMEAARRLGEAAAIEGVVIVSGDARGIDRAAMEAALDAGGQVIGVLADSLGKGVLSKRYRQAIASGELLLLSHTEPDARFTVAQAMERNRYIYAASDAVIVADSGVKGGTWNGAVENRKHGWSPAYVRIGGPDNEGRCALVREGLLEWSPRWLESGQSLETLFVNVSAENALPLFADDRVPDDGREKQYSAKDSSASPGAAGTPPPDLIGDLSHPEVPSNEVTINYKVTAPTLAQDRDILFELFVSRLGEFLVEYKPTTVISDHFGIHTEQAESWLRRAKRIGKVEFHEAAGWKYLQ